MTEDGLKSVIVKVGLTALVLACVGGVRDEPSNNRNTTVQVVEAADEGDFAGEFLPQGKAAMMPLEHIVGLLMDARLS